MAIIPTNTNAPAHNTILSRFYSSRNPVKNQQHQQQVLKKLLESAAGSSFGKQYNFNDIIESENIISAFQKNVPFSNYLTMKEWWKRCMAGESDVVTKGAIKYFALSSGTSDGSTKYIPVSKQQLSQFKRRKFALFAANGLKPRNT